MKPLVSSGVDLSDFKFMPLDCVRLRDSDLTSNVTGDEFRCAVLLWCASWHQIPAASLPNDDKVLSNFAGFGRVVKEWLKVKDGAMRGWILCDDGRLYHPVVAEKAIEAWRSKLEQRWKTECARIKKRNQRHNLTQPVPEFDEWVSAGCPQGQEIPVPADTHQMSQGQVAGVPKETQSKGQGRDREGIVLKEKNKPAPPTSETVARAGPEDPVDATPTPAGAICRSLRAAGIANVNPGHALLAALLEAGATEAEFLGAAPDAKDKRDPFAYVLGVVKGQREDAAKAAQSLLTGPLPTSPPPSAVTVQSRAAEQTAALLRADQEHRAEVARQREQRRLAEQGKAA